MESEHLKKFSDELKESREKTELTLEEISSKTRIDIKYLKAIESANFDIMPNVYMHAFIKEYAKQCKLDPEEVLTKYKRARKGKSASETEAEQASEKTEETTKKKAIKKEFSDEKPQPDKSDQAKFNLNKPTIITIIVLLLILATAAYFMFVRDNSPEIVVERPFEEVLEEKTQNDPQERFEIEDESSSMENISAVQDSLTLSMQAIDTCWVQVIIDGEQEREFMLFTNNSTTIKAAERFDLIIGNLGGVNLQLNGENLSVEGRLGERKTFSVNRDGILPQSN
ncbi:MAG: helix-turn-helix domain-containing protein [Melioribacteraceae bacterium]|nr:helix-turn-helix domain-containing protein [Melioribacteraceae bacterium]